MGRLASKPSTASVALVWEYEVIRPAKNNRAAFRACKGPVRRTEEEIKGLRWQQKVGLKSNRVNQ